MIALSRKSLQMQSRKAQIPAFDLTDQKLTSIFTMDTTVPHFAGKRAANAKNKTRMNGYPILEPDESFNESR